MNFQNYLRIPAGHKISAYFKVRSACLNALLALAYADFLTGVCLKQV